MEAPLPKDLIHVLKEKQDDMSNVEAAFVEQVADLVYDRDVNTNDGDLTQLDKDAMACAEMAGIYEKASDVARDYLIGGYSKAKKDMIMTIVEILWRNGLLISIDEAHKLGAEIS